ncbi:MAG: hypothetical protein WCE48_12255 [Steroidobacteraceae bacterium]
MGILVRLVYPVWLAGLVVLTLIATSQLLFASTGEHRVSRWISQLSLAALWPIAALTRASRETLRARFRN